MNDKNLSTGFLYTFKQVERINLYQILFLVIYCIGFAAVYQGLPPTWHFYVIPIGLFISTITFHRIFTSIRQRDSSETHRLTLLRRFLFVQVVINLFHTAIAIHLSGGPLSAAPMGFVLYISMLAVVFNWGQLITVNILSVILYVGLIELYKSGMLDLVLPPNIPVLPITRELITSLEIVYVGAMLLGGMLLAISARFLWKAFYTAQAQQDFLDQLNRLTQISLTRSDMPTMHQTLVDQLGDMLQASYILVAFWDEHTMQLAAGNAFQRSPARESDRIWAFIDDDAFADALRRLDQPLFVERTRKSAAEGSDFSQYFPCCPWLAFPMWDYPERQFLGCIVVVYPKNSHLTSLETGRAQQGVELVSTLISRARLYNLAVHRANLLHEFSTRITDMTSDIKRTSLLPSIVESARGLLKANRAALFLFDPAAARLRCEFSVGLSEEYILKFQTHFEGTRRLLASREEPFILVPDVLHDERTSPLTNLIRREGFRAYAVFALPSPDGPVGSLAIYWDQVHAITSEEIAVARLFANRAGALLHNAMLYDRATEEVLTDPLTGLPNRRHLDKRIIEEAHRTFRFGHQFSLLMIDLDEFKDVNDSFGHPMGDSVLQQVATNLQRAVRGSDFIARYGGDEFAVILPESGREAATVVAEKLRVALASCDIHLPNQTRRYISGSMGVAIFPEDTTVPDELVHIADKRLYASKNTASREIITRDTPSPQSVSQPKG